MLLYSLSVVVGLAALVDDNSSMSFFNAAEYTIEAWKGWPMQKLSTEMTTFYTLALGSYFHLFAFQFIDMRKKDFFEMFLHHTVTILLISLSWLTNFVKFGCLVIFVHDPVDVILEVSKLLNYVHTYGGSKIAGVLADIFFWLFTVTFVFTRLYVLPFYILSASLSQGSDLYVDGVIVFSKPIYLYWFFNGLLLVIQVLHLFLR